MGVSIGVAKWQDNRKRWRGAQKRRHEEPHPGTGNDTTSAISSSDDSGMGSEEESISSAMPMLPLIPPLSTVALPGPVACVRATTVRKHRAMPARHLQAMDSGPIQRYSPS
ncbi:hypothetical protein PG984_005722 [Apiospora sp. TS-2023a]